MQLIIIFLALGATSGQQPNPGARLLGYLHARGEALQISAPQPIKAVYVSALDPAYNTAQDMARAVADLGFNVIIGTTLQPSATGSNAVIGFCDSWQKTQATAGHSASNSAISYIHARGAVILASAGGAGEYPYTSDAAAYGRTAAQWVDTYHFDGLDLYLANIYNGFIVPALSSQELVRWIIAVAGAARAVFGYSACGPLMTHSPQVKRVP